MANRPLTGALLLGGASSRFGSPKALATLRGETLAERAWRTLGDACEERIAVGKEDFGLPFEVRIEPAEPQAPIVGLVEALRSATTETVIALPVDCPLVSPGLLRELGEKAAVPQTGPLPGAYAKDDLPELERRLARGDYSLRGVNPRTLDVDSAQLLDVDTRRDLALAAAVAWARAQEDVRALVLVGSLARAESPADEWSDVDLVALVDDPALYLEDGTWVAALGRPVLTFVEQTKLADMFERRVVLEGGIDVDIVLIPAAAADVVPTEAPVVLRRGYRILHDQLDLADRLAAAAAAASPDPPPTESELEQVCADLWYHGLWTAKKLQRGELWTALECLDAHMRLQLLTLLRWRAVLDDVPVWHGPRFVERWTTEPPDVLAATFARYDSEAAVRALWALLDLTGRLERELRTRLGFEAADRSEIVRLIEAVQPR